MATPVQPLPPPPKDCDGESHVSGKQYKLGVSNKDGYLCHVHLEATFDVHPETVFAMFTCPDNSHLFRDVKGVGGRKILKDDDKIRVVEVEQLGEIKVLWLRRTFSTHLQVVEDCSDPQLRTVEFLLQSSDVLSKFNGKWTLRPKTRDDGAVVTDAVLEQDILPKGVPPVMQHIPVLGGMIRGVSVRAVQRILEDIQAAVQKLVDGMPLDELLTPPDTKKKTKGKPAAPVGSFALDDFEEDDEAAEAAATQNKAVTVQIAVAEGDLVTLQLTPA